MSIRRGSALRASRKVMPILSYVLERMGYTTSCVGINLVDPPRLIPPHSVVYPHTSLASLKYCYNETLSISRREWSLRCGFVVENYLRHVLFAYHKIVLSALSIGRRYVEVGEVELDLPPVARLEDSHVFSNCVFTLIRRTPYPSKYLPLKGTQLKCEDTVA